MRVEVRTSSQVRILLDMANVKSQRRILNGERCHCQVTLTSGKVLDLEKEIPDFPLEPDIDIGKKNKFLNRLTQKIVDKES
jgi:hypothetical protein